MRESTFDPEDPKLYELSEPEARLILENFLRVERAALASAEMQLVPVILNYSRDSVVALFEYGILKVIGSSPMIDIYSPAFMRDEARVVWIGRMGYYLGEALIKSCNRLRWDIGDAETALANHPVVSGFKDGTEAPVVAVSRVLTARVLMDQAPFDVVKKAIDLWFERAH